MGSILAGVPSAVTTVEIQNPEADPLAGIGYVFAAVLAALAGASLLLVVVSVLARGGHQVITWSWR